MSLKIHYFSLTWSLIPPRKTRRSQWRTRWKISPRNFGYGKAVPTKWTSSMLPDYCVTL